ncbi:MAG: guanylate kinase [Desulfobacterium sp.]|nr:guanylate kinase [Desulfobacterium sp.]
MSHPEARLKENQPESKRSSSGRLYILSAPSGAGKTTLCQEILKHFPTIRYSISHTTRLPRPGERDGVDYFFITEEEFVNRIQEGSWAEWAKVHDNYYGTSSTFLNRTLLSGSDILLDIDVQGAMQIMKQYPDAITIFIMPPSLKKLHERLSNRGTDSDEVIEKRIQNAKKEIDRKDFYKHIVINDQLEKSKQELFQIINQYQTS